MNGGPDRLPPRNPPRGSCCEGVRPRSRGLCGMGSERIGGRGPGKLRRGTGVEAGLRG